MTRADQQDLVDGPPESLSCVSENRHVVSGRHRQAVAAPSNYLATVSDFQENIFFPREMLTGMKTKHCPISLTLSRHNHSKVTAGNLKYGPG